MYFRPREISEGKILILDAFEMVLSFFGFFVQEIYVIILSFFSC